MPYIFEGDKYAWTPYANYHWSNKRNVSSLPCSFAARLFATCSSTGGGFCCTWACTFCTGGGIKIGGLLFSVYNFGSVLCLVKSYVPPMTFGPPISCRNRRLPMVLDLCFRLRADLRLFLVLRRGILYF